MRPSPAPRRPLSARIRRSDSRPAWLALAVPVMSMLAVLAVLALPGCGGRQGPSGELLEIQDEQHGIANPSKIGASATGRGCAVTREEALTSARRVAQFNLRSLTGQARYNVRFDLREETRTQQGWCVVVSALAVRPVPYER